MQYTVGTTKIVMSGGQACVDNKDGSTWTVEFLQTFGSLPLMVPDSTNLLYANALSGDDTYIHIHIYIHTIYTIIIYNTMYIYTYIYIPYIP